MLHHRSTQLSVLLIVLSVLAACGPATPSTVDTTGATRSAAASVTATPSVSLVTAGASPATNTTPAACTAPPAPSAAPNTTTVFVYFPCFTNPQPRLVTAVPRQAPATSDSEVLLEAALRALVQGPTEAERAARFFVTRFSSGGPANVLKTVTLDEAGTATIDFTDFLSRLNNVGTSAGGGVLISQLNSTVFQFSEVQAVIYQSNGSCEAFYAALEDVCMRMTRAEWEAEQAEIERSRTATATTTP